MEMYVYIKIREKKCKRENTWNIFLKLHSLSNDYFVKAVHVFQEMYPRTLQHKNVYIRL